MTLKSNLLHERRSALARGASIGLASPGRQVIHILVPGGSVGALVKHNEVSWDGPPREVPGWQAAAQPSRGF